MIDERSVAGERTVAQMQAPRSLAVRLQHVLATALALIVAGAVLVWYYVHLGDEARARAATGAASVRSAVTSEMKLPAIEARRPQPPRSDRSAEGETRIVSDAPAAQGWAAPHAAAPPPEGNAAAGGPPTEGRDRQAAPVLVRPPAAGAPGLAQATLPVDARDAGVATEAVPAGGRAASATTLGDALQPTVTKPVEAALVPSRRWLLPKGSFLDCTLETAIDSTFPGLATCVLAGDAFGADGRVVLLERGTRLIGETRSDVRAGQARVAVLWSEARTPTGVVVNLASPGTDALGRAGVPGAVDRHTGERFGAAVLLSIMDVALSDFAARRQGSGAVIYNSQGTEGVVAEVLRDTIAIPPTIRIAPGARVMVAVVRDIDFRAVYRLVAHEER